MRPDQGSLNSFSIMSETGQTILRHILEAPYPGTSNVSIIPWSGDPRLGVMTVTAFIFLPEECRGYNE